MTNVIKVKLKKTTEVGLRGIMTETYEEGKEGFVVDAVPQTDEGKLKAGYAVFFPDCARVAVFQSHELDVIEEPSTESDAQIGLVRLIGETIALSFEMQKQGVDLSFLTGKRQKKADKPAP